MFNDSITYTSFEAIWGEVSEIARCFKSGLIDKSVLELQDIVLLL